MMLFEVDISTEVLYFTRLMNIQFSQNLNPEFGSFAEFKMFKAEYYNNLMHRFIKHSGPTCKRFTCIMIVYV